MSKYNFIWPLEDAKFATFSTITNAHILGNFKRKNNSLVYYILP